MRHAPEDIRTLVERFHDQFLNTGDPAAADRFVDPDCVLYWAGQRQASKGPDAYRRVLDGVRRAFPDIRWTVEELLVEGDRVVERARATATHMGDFLGVPATGRTVTWEGLALFTVRNGKIVSEWAMPNLLGILQQLDAGHPASSGEPRETSQHP